jgi:hypothetical protein
MYHGYTKTHMMLRQKLDEGSGHLQKEQMSCNCKFEARENSTFLHIKIFLLL